MGEQSEEALARARWADKMRKLGKPMKVLPHEFEQAHAILMRARAVGMDDSMIGAQVGLDGMSIYKIRVRLYRTMHRSTYEALLRLRPEEITSQKHPSRGKVPDGAIRAPHGMMRRLQALRADGFSNAFLAEELQVSGSAVSQLTVRLRKGVYHTTHAEVRDLYDRLAGTNPDDHGIPADHSARSRNRAAALGWAPSWTWDDDTLDNPAAHPEWTGACGTPQGRATHKREGIPMCDACKPATGSAAEDYVPLNRAEFLRAYKALGFTAASLAALLDCSPDSVYRWRSGERSPRRAMFNQIADVLGVRPEELTADDDTGLQGVA